MRAHPMALVCCWVPILTVAVCFGLSRHLELIPACNPFLAGCASVSAACRQEPAIHLFRLFMLPLSTVLAGYWAINRDWLRRLGVPRGAANGMAGPGVVGAAFLALYVVFLGTESDLYRLLRRFGTTTFFGGTGLAQLMLAAHLYRLPGIPEKGSARAMLWISAIMLTGGILYIPASNVFDASEVENILEWNFALLMQIQFGLGARMWRIHDLRIGLRE